MQWYYAKTTLTRDSDQHYWTVRLRCMATDPIGALSVFKAWGSGFTSLRPISYRIDTVWFSTPTELATDMFFDVHEDIGNKFSILSKAFEDFLKDAQEC